MSCNNKVIYDADCLLKCSDSGVTCWINAVVLKVCGAPPPLVRRRVLTGGEQVTWQESHGELMFNIGITFMSEQRNSQQLHL